MDRKYLKYLILGAITLAIIGIALYIEFDGAALGIVQGISEWLPISSKTQIMIASSYLLNLNLNIASNFSLVYTFGLFMEIGTILASLIYFRKDVVNLLKYLVRKGSPTDRKLFNYVIVSTIVTGLVGAPLYLVVDSLSGAYNLGIPMLILGAVLILDAVLIKIARSKYAVNKDRRTLQSLGIKEYVLVGFAQGLAALPGVSRSGATTSTLLLLNVDAGDAFRLSFIDMILATSGAVVLTLVARRHQVMHAISLITVPGLIISIIVATIISLFMITFLLNEAKKTRILYITAALGIIAIIGGVLSLMLATGGAAAVLS
ncbi:MAG: undecaprenyl-diphosphatase [Candidatus Marsarchaeota archaeon]|nr:undecaprenyl-diphosphatase [Candidatus Marsarchaeota archaeon]